MDKKVSYIIIILITIITILFLVLLSNNDKKDNQAKITEKYLIIDNYSTWMYTNKWEKVNNSKISGKKLKTFINDELQGLTKLSFGSKWNLYNDNDEYVDYEGNFIAASPELKLLINKYTVGEIDESDINEINQILNEDFTINDFTKKELIVSDLNNDGVSDYIINVSNLDNENALNYYNLIYAKIDGDIKIILNKKIKLKDYYSEPIYHISEIININGKNEKYIILEKGYFSLAGKTGNVMYGYIDNNFKLVMED